MLIRIMISALALLAAASALAQPATAPAVPEGEVRVYRVTYLDPNYDPTAQGGIQAMVPRYTWWLEAEGSHSQVRYRGPLGQINVINAPVEVHDLLERKLLDAQGPAAER